MQRIRLKAMTDNAISVFVPFMPLVRQRPDIIRFIVPSGCTAEHLRKCIRSACHAFGHSFEGRRADAY